MLKNVIQTAIELALLPARMKSKKAVVMLLAISLQESRFIHRRQAKELARGFWKFESVGGVRGVLNFHSTHDLAKHIALERIGTVDRGSIYKALEHDDVLAAAFARLLFWTDPQSLPELGDAQAEWDLYLRTWDDLYHQALKAVADYE